MSNTITKDRKSFAQMPNNLLNDIRVSLTAKGLYAFMESKPANWNFTIRSMAKQLKEGETAIGNALKDLKDAGWISYTKFSNGKGSYHLFWNCQDAEIDPEPENPHVGITKQGKPQRISNKDSVVIKIDSNSIVELKPDIAEKVIQYLNDKAGRRFRPVAANKQHINARLKEGATPKDLVSVIDRKCAEWLDDPQMAQYLRPSTLFNASKFNDYLGQIDSPLPAKRSDSGASRADDPNDIRWIYRDDLGL